MKKFLYGLTSSLLFAATVQADIIDETRAMDSDGRVYVEVVNGDVTLRGWDRDEFQIVGKLSDSAIGYELEVQSGNIRFEEEFEERSGWGCWFVINCRNRNRGQSSFEIFVPFQSRVNLEGINVQMDIANLENDFKAETVNGRIVAENITGNVNFETVNGSIRSSNLKGKRIEASAVNGSVNISDSITEIARFSTVNGRITLDIQAERIEAETVNGKINAKAGTVDEIDASTVNGKMEFSFTPNSGAEIEISSFNGDINLDLPENSDATFTLKTRGNISNDLSDHTIDRSKGVNRKNELSFSLGDGSADIEISSFSGDISLDVK